MVEWLVGIGGGTFLILVLWLGGRRVPPGEVWIVEGGPQPEVLLPGWHWIPPGRRVTLSVTLREKAVSLLEGDSWFVTRDGIPLQIRGGTLWLRLNADPRDRAQVERAARQLRQLEDAKSAVRALFEGPLIALLQTLNLEEIQTTQDWLGRLPQQQTQLQAWGLRATRLTFRLAPRSEVIEGAAKGEGRALELGRGLRRTAEEIRYPRRVSWDQAFTWARELLRPPAPPRPPRRR